MAKAILVELQFFPPVEYFTRLLHAGEIHLEQMEHYEKGSYRNRCHIAAANGIQRLSVPLRSGKNQQQAIREVQIAYDEPWQARHWQAIQTAYGNSPFFEHYAPELSIFYATRYHFLWDLNLEILKKTYQLLGIKPDIKLTEEWQPVAQEGIVDLRSMIHPKKPIDDKIFKASYYPQVFEDRLGFKPNLSVLDVLFCAGPGAKQILKSSILSAKE